MLGEVERTEEGSRLGCLGSLMTPWYSNDHAGSDKVIEVTGSEGSVFWGP